MKLWLDDTRNPAQFGRLGFHWVKNAETCINTLKDGKVTFVSLDNDLAPEHYPFSNVPEWAYEHKTGYDVLKWMAANNVWPVDGVEIHTGNLEMRLKMLNLARKYINNVFIMDPSKIKK